MNRSMWLAAFIASSVFAGALSAQLVARNEGIKQTVDGEAAQTGIVVLRHGMGRRSLPRKPPSSSPEVQSQQPVESEANVGCNAADFIEFDAPGAGTGASEGTQALAINVEGEITGYYTDANGADHGFLRYPEGRIVTFDAPGAGTGFYEGTQALAINLTGKITGDYSDANGVYHGFLREPSGQLITFDVPGVGTGPGEGTFPAAIDSEGAITGNYCSDAGCQGFLRTPNGTITPFDPASSAFVFPSDINDTEAITGFYVDANNFSRGFLRNRAGDVTTFDPPNSESTMPTAINLQGEITGQYQAPEDNLFGYLLRGFIRNRNGAFTTFDAATYAPCCIFTYPTALNLEGTVTGYDNDGANLYHGFVRTPDGAITTFDAPGAGKSNSQGTLAYAINIEGEITGHYIDANGAYHGFIRRLRRH